MSLYDVVIIGGGPSGLYAARLLALSGLEAVVLERKPSVGQDVVCTGIVNSEIFREYDIGPDSRTGDIQSVRMIGPGGETVLYSHPAPFASVVDRSAFDRGLAARAVEAGARVKEGRDVSEVCLTAEGVEVRTASRAAGPEKWRARMAVLATGCHHRLLRRAGLKPPRTILHGVQAEIPSAGEEATAVYLGRSYVQAGFGWAVPARSGRMKIGLLTHGSPLPSFEKFAAARFPGTPFERFSPSLGLRPVCQGMAAKSVADRVLALGEAAGQVKTTTGGGISFGLLGARLASETILDGYRRGRFDAGILSAYERNWKNALKREIAVGQWAWKIFSWLSESHLSSLFAIARSDGVIPLIQRQGDFDRQSGLILDLIRKTSVFDFFKGLASRPPALDRFLN